MSQITLTSPFQALVTTQAVPPIACPCAPAPRHSDAHRPGSAGHRSADHQTARTELTRAQARLFLALR